MRYAHPTRRHLELQFEGLDEQDLTELLASHAGEPEFPVETGVVHDELATVTDLLAEFDAVFEAAMAEQAARAVLRILPGRRVAGFDVEGEAA